MRRLILALAALLAIGPAFASSDPVADTRQIMAGTVTTKSTKNAYLSGARDGTAAFQGALSAYKAVRAAEQPPAPPPPPPAPPPVVAPIQGEQPIADTFDTNLGLEATWFGPPPAGSTLPPNRGGIAPISPDPVGAFRFMCTAGQIAKDDPIVFPGQPGASHLHQFWGNTGTNASSTFQSLRTSGSSTCDNHSSPGTPVNRTGYWAPAMLDGAGNVVKPDFINTYYKQLPHGNPECKGPPDATHAGWCVDLPHGLRFVFGWNPTTMRGGPNDLTGGDYYTMWFECWSDLTGAPSSVPSARGQFHSIAALVTAGCPAGEELVAQGVIPQCWDGLHTDSPDHRSHIVGYMPDPANGVRCPLDHPYVIPAAQFRLHYTTDANFVAGKWHFSSDEMMPGAPAGTTFHFDYFEAWSPNAKNQWFRNCIDKHETCANGDLGNGMQMKDAGVPNGGWTRHQLVPVP